MRRLGKGFTLLELTVTIAIIAILCAVSAPNFLKLASRAKQSEARSNLKALYSLENAYYEEKDEYTASVSKLGFRPERGNRYRYTLNGLDGGGSLEDRSSTITSTPVTAQGIEIDLFKFPNALADAPIPNSFPCGTSPFVVTGALGSFLAGAIGNIDGDATADMWTISSQNRRTSGCDADANVVAGEPANEQNDLQK